MCSVPRTPFDTQKRRSCFDGAVHSRVQHVEHILRRFNNSSFTGFFSVPSGAGMCLISVWKQPPPPAPVPATRSGAALPSCDHARQSPPYCCCAVGRHNSISGRKQVCYIDQQRGTILQHCCLDLTQHTSRSYVKTSAKRKPSCFFYGRSSHGRPTAGKSRDEPMRLGLPAVVQDVLTR